MHFYLSKEVMPDDDLRGAFNALTAKTFGFSFEEWYQKGYWSDLNIPYTMFDGGKAIANISVNRLNVLFKGRIYQGIQLGTVMTDEAYRGQGLSRFIMGQVKQDWEDKCDLMFLFANKSVLDFYPKFGFEKKIQYRFEKRAGQISGSSRKLDMDLPQDRQILEAHYRKTNPFSKMQVIGHYGLLMFYCISAMKDCVYYAPSYDAVVIAEQDGDRLRCFDVYCDKGKDLQDILSSVAGAGTQIFSLEFTLCDDLGFDVSLNDDDEDTLFVLSKGGRTILEDGAILFPTIAHT